MQPLDSIERRMAALFLLLMILIVWQAVRTHPLQSLPLVLVLEPGEQVFPVAVPPEGAPRLPTAPAERLAFLKEHAVKGFAALPGDTCEGFVRISAHHWLRVPIARELLAEGQEAEGRVLYLTGKHNPLAQAGIPSAGAGAEAEVFFAP
jgi:hypothetical protein